MPIAAKKAPAAAPQQAENGPQSPAPAPGWFIKFKKIYIQYLHANFTRSKFEGSNIFL